MSLDRDQLARQQRLAALQRERLLFGTVAGTMAGSPTLGYTSDRERDGGSMSAGVEGRLLIGRDGRHVFVEDSAADKNTAQSNAAYGQGGSDFGLGINRTNTSSPMPGSPVRTMTTLNTLHSLGSTGNTPSSISNFSSFDDSMAALASLLASSPQSNAISNMQTYSKVHCASCSAKKQLALMDAWKPAPSTSVSTSKKKGSSNSSASTDKTLLSLIEQERAKYLLLESTHSTLLTNLSHLHQAHRADMSRLAAQYSHEINTLKLDMREQNDRVSRAARVLVSLVNRYPHSSSSYPSEMGSHLDSTSLLLDAAATGRDATDVIDALVGRVDATLRANTEHMDLLDAATQEHAQRLSKLTDKLHSRDQEIAKLALYAQDRDAECTRERDAKLKLEVRAVHLERALNAKVAEFQKLSDLYSSSARDAAELPTVRDRLETTQTALQSMSQREKMYLDEIELGSSRERKLSSDLDAACKAHAGKCKEIETILAAHAKETSLLKDVETRLRQDLNESYKIGMQHADKLALFEKQQRSTQQETSALQKRLHDTTDQLHELHKTLKLKESELNASLANEREWQTQYKALKHSAEAQSNELTSVERALADTRARLDQESASKSNMQQQNTTRLGMVAEKISFLQQSLTETQQQVAEFRETETNLRNSLRQKEDTIVNLHKEIQRLEQRGNELEESLADEGAVLETLKSKKKEELMAVQEKFALAKNAMENEVLNLRNQLAARSAQVSSQGEEISKIKIELSELTADRFRLEARCAELLASESSSTRQHSNLAQLLKQKEQDLAIMGIKHEALVEQVRLLEDELHMYRDSSMGRMQKQQDTNSDYKRVSNQNSTDFRRQHQNDSGTGAGNTGTSGNSSHGLLVNANSPYGLMRQASILSGGGASSGARSRSNSNLYAPASPLVSSNKVNFDSSATPSKQGYVSIAGMDDYSLSFLPGESVKK
ncbi:hypothetical protein HDU81_009906 [Chytriomyces hyalinus]|nr:hypothetical protein HDU81_009906 [Chytriomyces hyalinus]